MPEMTFDDLIDALDRCDTPDDRFNAIASIHTGLTNPEALSAACWAGRGPTRIPTGREEFGHCAWHFEAAGVMYCYRSWRSISGDDEWCLAALETCVPPAQVPG